MMEGWKQIKLGDVCNINNKNINKNFSFEDITYLDISSVGSGNVDFSNNISKNDAPSRAKRIPIKNDSIIATVRPGNKTYCYLNDFPENTVVSTGFAILSPIEEKIDSRYLYYIVSEDSFTSYLVSVEKGANYPAVSANDIADAKVTIPPIKTQRKIVAILSAYDDLIENNLKRIKLLEEQAQQTYEEWFVRFKFPGYENVEIDVVSGLPFGWEISTLGEFAKTSSGGTPSRKKESEYYENGTIPWVRTGELKNFILIDSEQKITKLGLSKSSAKLFPKKTVLLAMYGNTIGETTFLTFEASTNQACCGFLVKDDIYKSYFLHQFLLNQKEYILNFRMGAAQENISQGIIQGIKFKKPSKDILLEFEKQISPKYDLIEILYNQNQHLKEARDILLPRLMSGLVDPSSSSGQVVESL
ncbi:restriction endonuclease subunit S [Polaribacter sp. NJDZ03]|uniref:restriction endonuclease subunit S n=1 Tax=Polaribacter sp. NJDZ03 TaxID=2855841 RepID=UPI001C4A3CCF|nr:restriction endonuclease subunit S [Polaribacter sp. NJDZ03]